MCAIPLSLTVLKNKWNRTSLFEDTKSWREKRLRRQKENTTKRARLFVTWASSVAQVISTFPEIDEALVAKHLASHHLCALFSRLRSLFLSFPFGGLQKWQSETRRPWPFIKCAAFWIFSKAQRMFDGWLGSLAGANHQVRMVKNLNKPS